MRVTTERRGLDGGAVASAARPVAHVGRLVGRPSEPAVEGWNRDEWDVALADGALYRVYRDRTATGGSWTGLSIE